MFSYSTEMYSEVTAHAAEIEKNCIKNLEYESVFPDLQFSYKIKTLKIFYTYLIIQRE